MDKIKFLLDCLNSLYEIPMYCFDHDKFHYSTNKKYQDTDPFHADTQLFYTLTAQYTGSPMLILENEKIIYGLCKNSDNITCIVGPVSLSVLTKNEVNQYISEHNLLNHNNFMIYIGNIPKTATVLSILHHEMNDEIIDAYTIICQFAKSGGPQQIHEKDLFFYHFQKSEYNKERTTYAYEKALMTAFADGDTDTLNELSNPNIIDHIGQIACTPFKQLEYTAISGITIFSRAAIEGGANPDEVYNISDLYLQKVSTSTNESELHKILINIKMDLLNCVKFAKECKNRFQYIELCKGYVANNLYKRITLDDIADTIGINKCYLSHQFVKKEGKTLMRYIQEERIRAAQNMLKYSDQSLSVIASYLCFDSQSHFGSVFKKITGDTPSAYRLRNKADNTWPVLK